MQMNKFHPSHLFKEWGLQTAGAQVIYHAKDWAYALISSLRSSFGLLSGITLADGKERPSSSEVVDTVSYIQQDCLANFLLQAQHELRPAVFQLVVHSLRMAEEDLLSAYELAIRIRVICGFHAVSAHNIPFSAHGHESMPRVTFAKSSTSVPPSFEDMPVQVKSYGSFIRLLPPTLRQLINPRHRRLPGFNYTNRELLLARLHAMKLQSPAMGSRSSLPRRTWTSLGIAAGTAGEGLGPSLRNRSSTSASVAPPTISSSSKAETKGLALSSPSDKEGSVGKESVVKKEKDPSS